MRAMLLSFLLLLGLADPASAEEPVRRAVIVLDRGTAAEDGAAADGGNALRIWRALDARGVDARILACGVDDDGATVLEILTPSRAGLTALASTPAFAFRGATDPRAALASAAEGEGPVDVLLLGPFGPAAEGEEPDDAPGPTALAAWNAQAPEGSRLIAVRTAPDVLARLEGAEGLAKDGLLVIGFEPPQVEAGPFSALRDDTQDDARMEARVRVLADILGLGPEDKATAVLQAFSDVPDDAIVAGSTAGLHTFLLRRRARDGRTATLTFLRREGLRATWLGAPPTPLTFRWAQLLAEAALVGPDGAPPRPFVALDAEAKAPRTMAYRLRRARTGAAPAWRVAAEEGELPEGLEVEVGREIEVTPEIGESAVRVTFRASPGQPLQASGAILLSAEGLDAPLRLPYEVRVQPGRVRFEADVQPAALPQAQADPLSVLRLVAENGNAPTAITVHASCDGAQERWLRALLFDEAGGRVTWKLDEPYFLPVDAPRRIAFELDPEAPPEVPWPCEVTLRAEPPEGVTLEGTVVLTVRKRRPRIALAGPPPTFRLEEGGLAYDSPIVLTLDPDDGDGDWLLGLLTTPPTLRSPGDAPIGWQVVGQGSGLWHVVPSGEWTGRSPSFFTRTRAHVDLQIDWTRGRTPGLISVPVDIPPRWGLQGLVLLILAGLSLALASLTIGYMRTPAVTGTLLYSVEDVEGVVGRLDLGPVGRRPRAITADDHGKLSVAGGGETLGRIRPTRVGGMLEYTDRDGRRERRLLVDGVSLRIGRHLVRYVSGNLAGSPHDTPDAGADLLGPEYDLESGRIEALDEDPPEA